MPIEHASWILPAIDEGFKHREELLSVWESLLARLIGKKSMIAITGMPGVGKSVLLEHLTGEAYERDHNLPIQPSPGWETGKVLARRKRIKLITIPGQERNQRYKAARKAFRAKSPPVGVIHVVANGLATTRVKNAQLALQKQFNLNTIDTYKKHMLAEEVADLRKTCSFVRDCILDHRQPIWMFVVASKCDLYSTDLEQVEGYYSPFSTNGFVSELNALTEAVGSLNFEWDAMPACGTLEDFVWNGQVLPSTLKQSQRDQLITQLLRRIERNCEA